jgi:hypothetical protein
MAGTSPVMTEVSIAFAAPASRNDVVHSVYRKRLARSLRFQEAENIGNFARRPSCLNLYYPVGKLAYYDLPARARTQVLKQVPAQGDLTFSSDDQCTHMKNLRFDLSTVRQENLTFKVKRE